MKEKKRKRKKMKKQFSSSFPLYFIFLVCVPYLKGCQKQAFLAPTQPNSKKKNPYNTRSIREYSLYTFFFFLRKYNSKTIIPFKWDNKPHCLFANVRYSAIKPAQGTKKAKNQRQSEETCEINKHEIRTKENNI